MNDIKTRIDGLVARLNEMFEAQANGNPLLQKYITPQYGRRYVRLVVTNSKNPPNNFGSAYGFVDLTNGNLLKTASWSAPAKGARGNVYSADFGMSGCTRYGMIYYR